MKKIKIPLVELLDVLDMMHENGTQDVIIFEHQGYPTIVDSEDMENFVSFQSLENEELQDPVEVDGELH